MADTRIPLDPESPVAPPVRSRLTAHLRHPLTAGSYALLSSSVATGVLGLAYWVIAARVYDPADLGRASAVLATMMLATNLVSAGFKRGILRFVPGAGAETDRLIARIYTAAVIAAVLGAVALAVLAFGWSLPGWDDIESRWVLVAMLAMIPIWTLFTLQDAVLVAVRRPWLVPSKNVGFSLAKVVLVAVLAPVGAIVGVTASWAIPATVAVALVSVHLVRTRHDHPLEDRTPSTALTPTFRQMVSFTGAEHIAVVLWRTATLLLPVVVLARVDAAAAAGFYLADQVTYGVYLISSNVVDSAVAVASREDDVGVRAAFRSATKMIAVLAGTAVVALVLLAGPVMGVFGATYRNETSALLILLALAAIPNAVTTIVIGLAHVRRQMVPAVALQATMAVGTLGGALLLVGSRGITGVGIACLATQTIVAAGALVISRPLLLPTSASTEGARR